EPQVIDGNLKRPSYFLPTIVFEVQLQTRDSFPGSVKTERDFSGFDRDQWQPRCNELHRCHADMVRKTASKTTHENAMDVVLVCFWN
ncbi:hypothetical protein P5673_018308, partial [Acropora cervicornis]